MSSPLRSPRAAFGRAHRLGVALIAALLSTGSASAFELLRVDGNACGSAKNLSWPSSSADISVDPLATADMGTVLTAMSRWNESVPRFDFRSDSGDHCNRDDGVIGVAFADVDCNGRSMSGVLGVTVSIFRIDNGDLVDGSVTFNAGAAVLDDQALFLQTSLHELGHVLGLDHSDACGDSGNGTLMKTTIVLNAPRLDRPQSDDIAGAKSIYGGGLPPDPTPLPEGTNSCAVSRGAASWPMSLSLALAGLLVLRRRRRSPAR